MPKRSRKESDVNVLAKFIVEETTKEPPEKKEPPETPPERKEPPKERPPKKDPPKETPEKKVSSEKNPAATGQGHHTRVC